MGGYTTRDQGPYLTVANKIVSKTIAVLRSPMS